MGTFSWSYCFFFFVLVSVGKHINDNTDNIHLSEQIMSNKSRFWFFFL